jgi:hypothetical protein
MPLSRCAACAAAKSMYSTVLRLMAWAVSRPDRAAMSHRNGAVANPPPMTLIMRRSISVCHRVVRTIQTPVAKQARVPNDIRVNARKSIGKMPLRFR